MLANEQILLTIRLTGGKEGLEEEEEEEEGRKTPILAEIDWPVENVGGSFGVAISRPEVLLPFIIHEDQPCLVSYPEYVSFRHRPFAPQNSARVHENFLKPNRPV